MSFNSRIPNNVATHVRKYSSTAQMVAKSKAGAIGIVSGIMYYKATVGVLIPVTSSNFPDGTSPLPSIAFASEPTLGFWRSGAATVSLTGSLNMAAGNLTAFAGTFGGSISAAAASFIQFTGRGLMRSTATGVFTLNNNAETAGSEIKVDALPTVASGFGSSPAVIAGSTPFAGAVNVGTGGVATSGIINFNGTAFPSAPFVVCMNTTTGAVVRATTSTTQLTITAPAAFTASDVICWICVSSK